MSPLRIVSSGSTVGSHQSSYNQPETADDETNGLLKMLLDKLKICVV